MREEYIISYEIKVIPRTSIDSISTQFTGPNSSTAQSNDQAEQRSVFIPHSACLMSSPPYLAILLPCMCVTCEYELTCMVRLFYKLALTYEACILLQLYSICMHNYLSPIEKHLFGLSRWWQSNHNDMNAHPLLIRDVGMNACYSLLSL